MKPRYGGAFWLLLSLGAVAEPLPQPLSLQQALSYATTDHPRVRLQRARHEQAEAQLDSAESSLGIDARLIADGRLVEPSTNNPRISRNDSRLHLTVTRRLYDFGQSRAAIDAAEARVGSQQQRLAALLGQRRLEIMQAFFEVLLADQAFAVADEAMAIEYVRLDRLRQRGELGQASDVQLAEQDTSYQARRVSRYRAEARQRVSRSRLAETLNRAGELPAELIPPQLPALDREIPELDVLIGQALAGNPFLLALRLQAEADRQQLRAARNTGRPVISGELAASDYAREFTTRDRFRAGLLVDIPLYTGGRVDARRAEALARLHATEASIGQTEMEIRQTLRELIERIGVLRIERERAITEQAFRDLDLDRARTDYELEFASDLGNSMADSTAARLHRMQAEYGLLLAWSEIALITGQPGWELIE